ncbi:MAG TPA: ferritin-like domain-containing protein [Cyclobacteriaceae bacterium]|nr:ferritin-like domain-containing protein [Cyclobacteriaceae bacterium]
MATATKSKSLKKTTAPNKTEKENLNTTGPLMDLFINNLRSMYWAENHLVKALPRMKSESSSKELQKVISDHLKVTKGHVSRIEQAFNIIQQKPQATKCDAMEGLTLEGEGVIEDTIPGTTVRDLGINLSSQKVESYEITAYQGLISLATSLGLTEVADLLTETLKEEQDSLMLLSEMSQSFTA